MQSWRFVAAPRCNRGAAEVELIALMDLLGYSPSDIEAVRFLAARGVDRESAAEALLMAKRAEVNLPPSRLVGFSTLTYVKMLYAGSRGYGW